MLTQQSTTQSSWQFQQSGTEKCDPPRAGFNLVLDEPYCCPVLIFVLLVLAKAGGCDISANCLSHKVMEWFGLKGALKIPWFQPPCHARDMFHWKSSMLIPSQYNEVNP